MSEYLHGVHDPNGADLMSKKPGWILITEAIGSDPRDESGKNYKQWQDKGFSTIIRLNNGYYPAGTIPAPEHYNHFAVRCGKFVAASSGIERVIIGNEPNHANERPGYQIIVPSQYAKCYDLCYEQIKGKKPAVQVGAAPIAPWDATTIYAGNPSGDWIQYYSDMLNFISKTDFIALHAYTHGASPTLVTDNAKMNPPFQDYHYNFRAYVDFLIHTPRKYSDLPVYITECDQINPWANVNMGWMQEAYEEIDFWNHTVENQKIHCVCMYRTDPQGDGGKWSWLNKDKVVEDFKQ